jgi:uncharacterized protein VirK/YbjX
MSRQLPATLLKGYLSKQGFTLLTLTGKDEQQFTVRLCADAFLDKEGKPPSLLRPSEYGAGGDDLHPVPV